MKPSKQGIEACHEFIERYQKLLQNKVDEFLEDKNNDLRYRWEVWTKYSQTNSGNWIHHFPEDRFPGFDDRINNGEWHGRGQAIEYDEVIDTYYDSISEDIFKESKLNIMKEYLMENSLRSYKFDW